MKLQTVKCVECGKNQKMVTVKVCRQCKLHENMHCNYAPMDAQIKMLPGLTFQKTNRVVQSQFTEMGRGDVNNYYAFSKIMQPLKNIDSKPFKEFKDAFMRGGLRGEESDDSAPLDLEPAHHLVASEAPGVLTVRDTNYEISEKPVSNGASKEVYYLYDMFSLKGFAEIEIDNRGYAVRTKPVSNQKPDLVLKIDNDGGMIGCPR